MLTEKGFPTGYHTVSPGIVLTQLLVNMRHDSAGVFTPSREAVRVEKVNLVWK